MASVTMHDDVRFWLRANAGAVAGLNAVPGWTVISEIEDADTAGVWLVEISDPNAPAEAEGLICEPVLRTLQPTGDPDAPLLKIVDYGIPART